MYVYLRRFLVERILCAVDISTATTEKGRIGTIKFNGWRGNFLWRYDEGKGGQGRKFKYRYTRELQVLYVQQLQNAGSICKLGNGAVDALLELVTKIRTVQVSCKVVGLWPRLELQPRFHSIGQPLRHVAVVLRQQTNETKASTIGVEWYAPRRRSFTLSERTCGGATRFSASFII